MQLINRHREQGDGLPVYRAFAATAFFQIMATLPALQESGIWVGKADKQPLMLTGFDYFFGFQERLG